LQAAANSSSTAAQRRRVRRSWFPGDDSLKSAIYAKERTSVSATVMEALFWLLLEAGLALLALILIVWWTWPRRSSRKASDGEERKD
jgi:hypothetical protein